MRRIQQPPDVFMEFSSRKYPPHNNSRNLEAAFYKAVTSNSDLLNSNLSYLPIQWTNYLANNNYGKNIDELKKYIEEVVSNEGKFFSIIQYAGGPLVDVNDCLFFSMGGMQDTQKNDNLSYIYLPLLTEPHKHKERSRKKYLDSFQGRPTHNIRKKINKKYMFSPNYKINLIESINSQNQIDYLNLMNDSYFSLCPRGYGPTSFRLYETIGSNSVPVYISDKFILPLDDIINRDMLSVQIKSQDLSNLTKILEDVKNSVKYKEMLDYGKFCRKEYFNNRNLIKYILEKVSQF